METQNRISITGPVSSCGYSGCGSSLIADFIVRTESVGEEGRKENDFHHIQADQSSGAFNGTHCLLAIGSWVKVTGQLRRVTTFGYDGTPKVEYKVIAASVTPINNQKAS